MEIFNPEALHETGERQNNEDAIYPEKGKADHQDRLYLVCDGVGGSRYGEIASALICEHFPRYFTDNKKGTFKRGYLKKGLAYVESIMADFIDANPQYRDMATTLTLLYLSKDQNKALLAWVGDSKVYHIRDGKVLCQTKSHSEVQALIDMGEITEEEALSHPRRNIITRSVNGKDPARIDYKVIKNIKEGDYFLLCSDGILENLDTSKINRWIKKENDPSEIRQKIFDGSINRTKDNFSMYLIKVKSVTRRSLLNQIAEKAWKYVKAVHYYEWVMIAIVISLIFQVMFKLFFHHESQGDHKKVIESKKQEKIENKDREPSTIKLPEEPDATLVTPKKEKQTEKTDSLEIHSGVDPGIPDNKEELQPKQEL